MGGAPLTKEIFQQQGFVVKQCDNHWQYLTVRETLCYGAQLYGRNDPSSAVDSILKKLGLVTVANTKCSSLSGGQQPRLSIAFALLKRVRAIFFDEPTSGLDAAASFCVMDEIRKLAVSEQLIVICTIHQPSTRVFNSFKHVMLLSKGRQAFFGPVGGIVPYFESVGRPLPPATNPAEHVLDIVNSDFERGDKIEELLIHWEQTRNQQGDHSSDDGGRAAVQRSERETLQSRINGGIREINILVRRHCILTVRDPVLYLGRGVFFLLSNIVFALVLESSQLFPRPSCKSHLA